MDFVVMRKQVQVQQDLFWGQKSVSLTKTMDIELTCFQAVLLEVGAAAVVGFTQIVTSASRRFGLFQLEAPPLAGAR